MNSNSINKRKRITIETKVSIIEAVNAKTKSNAQICRQFDIPSSTLYTILKEKEKILTAYSSGDFSNDRKKIRRPDYASVDRALFLWFKQARSQNIPLSGPVLMEKGKEIADCLGLNDFHMTTSWLDRFKQRRGIAMRSVSNESSSVNTETMGQRKSTLLQTLLKDYRPCDIFNANETGLFYKTLPSCTLAVKEEACSGRKMPKDRITLLLAANMDGSEKLPLLTVGKFKSFRCLKNAKSLPTGYRANRNAWMTAAIFEEWVRELDRKFILQGRSVVLLVEDCAAHPHLTDLMAITLIFLPLDTSSILQPCDHGIIQEFKTLYRKRVLKSLIASVSVHEDINSHLKLTLLDALTMAASAWDEVRGEVIANCFRCAGFLKKTEANQEQPELTQISERNHREVKILFLKLEGEHCSVDQYLSIDNAVQTREELTTDNINGMVTRESTEEESEEADTVPVSPLTAMNAVKTLRHFLSQQENGNDVFKDIDNVESFVHNVTIGKRKQSTITAFFKPVSFHSS